MKKKDRYRLNNDINCLRETILGLATPKFCPMCAANYHHLMVDFIRDIDPEEVTYKNVTVREYDAEYHVCCDNCGWSGTIQPGEITGLIDKIM